MNTLDLIRSAAAKQEISFDTVSLLKVNDWILSRGLNPENLDYNAVIDMVLPGLYPIVA